MKQIWITRYGGPEVLEVRDVTLPPLREGEVTVGVRAAGFNFADLMAVKGLYPDAPKPPCVVGYEISGIVEELGPGVSSSWLGKEIMAFTRFGGYSGKVNLSPFSDIRDPGQPDPGRRGGPSGQLPDRLSISEGHGFLEQG